MKNYYNMHSNRKISMMKMMKPWMRRQKKTEIPNHFDSMSRFWRVNLRWIAVLLVLFILLNRKVRESFYLRKIEICILGYLEQDKARQNARFVSEISAKNFTIEEKNY